MIKKAAPSGNKCAICKINDADKTNSHVVPLCLIKNLVAFEGAKKARDKELSFSISSHQLSTAYVGRDILPEKVEKLFGSEIGIKVAEEGKNQFTQDYFLCSSCEKKLGELESFVNTKFLSPIETFRSSSDSEIIFKKDLDQIRLFFWSIIFRMSCTRFGNFRLPTSFEENLRAILNEELNGAKEHPIRKKFPLQICVVKARKSDSENIVLNVPVSSAPYYLFLNHFIVFYYYKEKSLAHHPQPYLGLEKYLDVNTLRETGKLSISKLKEQDYKDRSEAVLNSQAKEMNEQIVYYFTECYRKLVGYYPNQSLIKEFLEHLHNKQDSLGKYTLEGLAVIMHAFLKQKLSKI
jgi:hypothetical protein